MWVLVFALLPSLLGDWLASSLQPMKFEVATNYVADTHLITRSAPATCISFQPNVARIVIESRVHVIQSHLNFANNSITSMTITCFYYRILITRIRRNLFKFKKVMYRWFSTTLNLLIALKRARRSFLYYRKLITSHVRVIPQYHLKFPIPLTQMKLTWTA